LNIFNEILLFPKQVNIEWQPTKSDQAYKPIQALKSHAFKCCRTAKDQDPCKIIAKALHQAAKDNTLTQF